MIDTEFELAAWLTELKEQGRIGDSEELIILDLCCLCRLSASGGLSSVMPWEMSQAHLKTAQAPRVLGRGVSISV